MDQVYLSRFKKNAKKENAKIVFEDEASFRQTPTLHQTWALVNSQPKIPSKGERNTQKIFGAIELDTADFVYSHKKKENFNHETYIEFLEKMIGHYCKKKGTRVFLIQDNASYHKKSETYAWFSKNRRYIEVYNLPPYCPELNAAEQIWKFTRAGVTHNRYYDREEALCGALFKTFGDIQDNPSLVKGLLAPFL